MQLCAGQTKDKSWPDSATTGWLKWRQVLILQRVTDHVKAETTTNKIMITFDVSGEVTSSSPEWKKCDVIAKVIANCPSQAKSVEEYYKLVSPQVSYSCNQAVIMHV